MSGSSFESEIESLSGSCELNIRSEITEAIQENKPVVALETVNSFLHGGATSQQKLETVLRCYESIKRQGALPAPIAVFDGSMKIGMTQDELEQLAIKSYEGTLKKVSPRDIPFALGSGSFAATTVAAAMAVASRAGIRFLAAGGVGGVHKHGQQTFDVSQDLNELSKSSVALICSGSEAIIDAGLTLEYLETLSVPVIGYQTDDYPRFCVHKSGIRLEHRLDSVKAISRAVYKKWSFGLAGGVLIANPVPEPDSVNADMVNVNLQRALKAMHQQGVQGSACTDYLLDKVNEYTGGKILDSNIALLVNNARLAAQLAVEYSHLLTLEKNNDLHATR